MCRNNAEMRRKVRHVHLLDTSVATDNIGDEVIVEAARKHLLPSFLDCYITSSSTHDGMGAMGRHFASRADIVFLLGTNALSSTYRVGRRSGWCLNKPDVEALQGRLVLVGVGANRTFENLEWRQRRFLRRVLSSSFLHSVRDESARSIVEAAGLNAINTSCPTMWDWDDGQRFDLGGQKGSVCFSLTAYKPHESDRAMIAILRKKYQRLLFWPQMFADVEYLENIDDTAGIEIIAPNLEAYDQVLANPDLDVIGSRLHGGLRALAHGRRTLIIEIDNRAREIGRDTGLPTLPRASIEHELERWIDGRSQFTLTMSREARQSFLAQFGTPG